jgi:subtilisin-like proprotein convertase family protein
MGIKNCKALTASICALALSASAQQEYSFTDTVNAPIPDANPNGLSSTIDVADIPGLIGNVTLSLNVSGGFNGDLYAYLAGDNGGFSVLLNRVGRTSTDPTGYGDAGFNVTFSDSAATDIHTYGGNGGNQLTGTWQPDGRNIDPQLVLDTDPRTSLLSSFNNRTPNGTWTLFVGDFANESQSTLISWTLTIDAVPEPSSLSLFGTGLGILWVVKRRRRANQAN